MNKFIKLIYTIIGILGLSLITVAHAAVYTKVPGTAVYVSAPEGFQLTDQFSGFIDSKTGATILVATMPPASSEMQSLFNDEKRFKAQMVSQHYIINRQTFSKTRDGFLLAIYQGKQEAASVVYDKWSTMIFASNATYVVTIQAPEKISFPDTTAMSIFNSLSVSNDNQPDDQLRALPFTFAVQLPFEFVGSIMNSSAMLTIPALEKDDAGRPDIILSKGLENVKGQSLDNVVETYLKSLDGTVNNIENRQITPVKFAGHDGLRLQATARMKDKPVDLIIYAAIGNDGRPMFLHATGEKGKLAAYNTQIEQTANSVALRNEQERQSNTAE